ncbi:MAG: hypothetical protein J6B77_05380, partial [Clostridia bacterium]|nr:hypothetical protein [Clostridia bacterium]
MDFQINIHDRVAELRSDDGRMPVLVCDNTDHRILFSFDAEWGMYPEKTARFVFRESFGQGSLVYVDVPFVGTSVNVPSLHNVREVWVGVIAGGLITTSAARISCLSSIYGFPAIEEGSENTEAKEVSLCFAEGDTVLDVQTVTPSLGKTMASVGIKRPAMLIPENIRAGITIAGITGTYSAENVQGSVLVPPTISLSGDILTIVPGEGELSESFEILVGGETAYQTTETTVNLKTALVGLPMGTRLITVIAWNDTLGLNSPSSNSVSYTVGALTAPTISLSGDILKISPGSGEVQIYRLYAGSSEIYSFAADTS